ncbi:MAG: hypothetical protein KF819_01265 [Labilithrix sp.]|nr:hypothetical protein [Labilithrix sp.]
MRARVFERVGLLAIAIAACKPAPRAEAGGATDAAVATAAARVESDAGLAPLAGAWMERVDLDDGGVTFIAPPVGAREKRPIVVAVHGAVDDPGLMCSAWRLVTDVFPFVVCPGGTPIGPPSKDRKYVWGSADQIEKRAREALETVAKRYPAHVDPDAPAIYAAFSQGATLAAPMLARNAKRFPRVVLTEGGYHSFEAGGLARAFASGGGERVLFTCSTGGCAAGFGLARAALDRAAVGTRVAYAGALGHSLVPRARESINAELPWLVEGMRGWEGYARAPKLAAH